MKKIAVVLGLLLTCIVPINSNAADEKSLVIIDSYFDSRVSGITIVCIPTVNCATTAKPATSLSDNTNHGDAMVEVAKKQNPNLKIIALRSAVTPTSDVNAGNFIDALTWVNNNSTNIGAVSFSRFFNGTTTCSPSSINTANYGGVQGADKKIKELISTLNLKGIPVFVATGNAPKKVVDYPACIVTTMATTSPGNASDVNTDFSADLIKTPLMGNNFVSPVFKLIPLTTSSATAAVAAKWVTTPGFSGLMVSVSS